LLPSFRSIALIRRSLLSVWSVRSSRTRVYCLPRSVLLEQVSLDPKRVQYGLKVEHEVIDARFVIGDDVV
jgi:hypothetical protein